MRDQSSSAVTAEQGGLRRTSAPVLTALVAIALALGVLAGILIAGGRLAPPALSAPPTATTMPVVLEPFDDPHQVSVKAVVGQSVPLRIHQAGTITAAACTPGGRVSSGSTPWRVNGIPILALATSTPFYRSLPLGSTGDDVKALQTELVQLRQPVKITGSVDAASVAAVWSLLAADRSPDSPDIPLSRLVWLPAASTKIKSCTAELGAVVAAGDEIARTRATIIGLKLSAIPGGMSPGDRAAAIDDFRLHMSADGVADRPAEVQQFAATQIAEQATEQAAGGEESGVPATLRLTTSIQVAQLPASALIGDATATCVVDPADRKYAVTVLDSSLGRSTVRFAGPVPATVNLQPAVATTCR